MLRKGILLVRVGGAAVVFGFSVLLAVLQQSGLVTEFVSQISVASAAFVYAIVEVVLSRRTATASTGNDVVSV